MARPIRIEGPATRVTAVIQLNTEFFKAYVNRSEQMIYHQLAVANYNRRSYHYRVIMQKTGFKKAMVLRSLSKLISLGLVAKLGGGHYKNRVSTDAVTAKLWEIDVLQGCTWEQLRTWRYVKLNESVAARPASLAKKIGTTQENLYRGLNDRPTGAGLISLGLIIRKGPRWYTPTGLSSSRPASTNRGGATHARTCVRSAVEEKVSSLSFRISRVIISTKSIFRSILFLSEGAARRERAGGVSGFVSGSYPQKRMKSVKLIVGDTAIEQDRVELAIADVSSPRELLITHPWSAQIPEDFCDQLLAEVKHVRQRVVLAALRKALSWVTLNRPGYNRPYPFLLKWLRSSRNIECAAYAIGVRQPYSCETRTEASAARDRYEVEDRAFQRVLEQLAASEPVSQQVIELAKELGVAAHDISYVLGEQVRRWHWNCRHKGWSLRSSVRLLLKSFSENLDVTVDNLSCATLREAMIRPWHNSIRCVTQRPDSETSLLESALPALC